MADDDYCFALGVLLGDTIDRIKYDALSKNQYDPRHNIAVNDIYARLSEMEEMEPAIDACFPDSAKQIKSIIPYIEGKLNDISGAEQGNVDRTLEEIWVKANSVTRVIENEWEPHRYTP